MSVESPNEPRALLPPPERGRSASEARRVGVMARNENTDRKRDQWLADHGVTVMRFWNSDAAQNLAGVLEAISAKVQDLRASQATPTRRWRADLPLQGEVDRVRGTVEALTSTVTVNQASMKLGTLVSARNRGQAADMVVRVGDEQRRRVSAPSFTRIVDFAVGSHPRAIAVLLAIALLCFLPGFFSIPPIDRDEGRFAQATKQMVESGDYIDIRFQDEVRYKKPVGIYWLQAGVVKAAQALGYRQALTSIWLYRVPSLVGAIGAVLLTYWAALALVPRRAAVLAAVMMASCVLLGIRTPHRQDRCRAAVDHRGRHGCHGARLHDRARAAARGDCCLDDCRGVLDRACHRRAAQGAADRHDRRPRCRRPGHRRPLGALASGVEAGVGRGVAGAAGAAVVPGHRRTFGRCVLRGVDRTGPGEQDLLRTGIARRAAGLLLRAVLGHLLAGSDARRAGDAGGVGASAACPRPGSCWPGWCRHGSCSSW